MPVLDGLMFFDIIASLELATIYISYKSFKKITNYKIKKDFDTTDIEKIILPETLKETIQNSSSIRGDTLKKATIEFAKVLTSSFDDEILENFNRNIQNLKIRNMVLFEYIKSSASGYYSLKNPENTIAIFDYISIFHELFHMASSYYDEENGVSYSGFETTYKTNHPKIFKIFGKGINEGYTELLTKRYFEGKHGLKLSYKKEMNIAYHIELIVGQNLMEKLYLTANGKDLLNELKKYAPAYDVFNLINELDKKRINLKLIYSDLLKMYKNKVMLQVKNGEYSSDTATKCIENFEISLLGDIELKTQNLKQKKGLHN